MKRIRGIFERNISGPEGTLGTHGVSPAVLIAFEWEFGLGQEFSVLPGVVDDLGAFGADADFMKALGFSVDAGGADGGGLGNDGFPGALEGVGGDL